MRVRKTLSRNAKNGRHVLQIKPSRLLEFSLWLLDLLIVTPGDTIANIPSPSVPFTRGLCSAKKQKCPVDPHHMITRRLSSNGTLMTSPDNGSGDCLWIIFTLPPKHTQGHAILNIYISIIQCIVLNPDRWRNLLGSRNWSDPGYKRTNMAGISTKKDFRRWQRTLFERGKMICG